MKLLLDQNLSHYLCSQLKEIFPEILHVKELSFQSAADDEVWEYAKKNSFAVVTKDSDFNERSIIKRIPAQNNMDKKRKLLDKRYRITFKKKLYQNFKFHFR